MDKLKPCPLRCDMKLLNVRLNNLSAELASMGEKNSIQANKKFLFEVLNYMQELHDLRREEENRRVSPENKPLTLDELRQMDGEPVWCDWINGWALIYIDGTGELNFLYSDDSSNSNGELIGCLGPYGKKWLAYARKPEQEEWRE